MFRKLYNRALFEGVIEPDGPILIVQGGLSLDPTAPDLAFVRTRHRGTETVYLPGSSLKGVVRSHAERLLATEIGLHAAEDPFDTDARHRSRAREHRKNLDRPAVYAASCAADRLFGSTEIAGRFRISDAFPTEETLEPANRTQVRYSVAIDRPSQGPKGGALFEQEAVIDGAFRLRATVENFELWMLALLLQAFRDLADGLVQVGHAKTRGFGTVRLESPSLKLLWPGARPERLEGAGARERDAGLRAAYGLSEEDVADLPATAEQHASGMLQGFAFHGWEALQPLLDTLVQGPWSGYVERAREEVPDAS